MYPNPGTPDAPAVGALSGGRGPAGARVGPRALPAGRAAPPSARAARRAQAARAARPPPCSRACMRWARPRRSLPRTRPRWRARRASCARAPPPRSSTAGAPARAPAGAACVASGGSARPACGAPAPYRAAAGRRVAGPSRPGRWLPPACRRPEDAHVAASNSAGSARATRT